MRKCWCLLLVSACGVTAHPSAVSVACGNVCSELVDTCKYAAFPTLDTCHQGCGYWEKQGVDVDSYLSCTTTAACDTFQIVECEHEFGISTVQ